jgi:hypothetical protein
MLHAFPDEQSKLRRRSADLLDPENEAWGLRVVLYVESLAVWVNPELTSRLHEGIKTVYAPPKL